MKSYMVVLNNSNSLDWAGPELTTRRIFTSIDEATAYAKTFHDDVEAFVVLCEDTVILKRGLAEKIEAMLLKHQQNEQDAGDIPHMDLITVIVQLKASLEGKA